MLVLVVRYPFTLAIILMTLGYVRLAPDTTCGFFDTWQGSCSLLGIRLEKPVKLPLDVVEILPDGLGRFAIGEVFDYSPERVSDIWKTGCIQYWGLPRGFRRDAAAMGIDWLPASRKHADSD